MVGLFLRDSTLQFKLHGHREAAGAARERKGGNYSALHRLSRDSIVAFALFLAPFPLSLAHTPPDGFDSCPLAVLFQHRQAGLPSQVAAGR
ncbi:hypothetical protein BDV12DRAFT_144181 [Aspergillus spectabilis]